jgi:hypothetical protein
VLCVCVSVCLFVDIVGVVSRSIGASIQPVRIFRDALEVIVVMESVMGLSNNNDRVDVVYKTCVGLLNRNDANYTNGVHTPMDSTKEMSAHTQGQRLSVVHVTTKSFNEYKQLKDELLKLDGGVGLPFGASYSKTKLGACLLVCEREKERECVCLSVCLSLCLFIL